MNYRTRYKMKLKYKVLLALIFLTLFSSFLGIAYSFFRSDVLLDADKDIAKFIFNSENLDAFQLSLADLTPGDEEEYLFSVNNNNESITSDVTIEYQMTIKTYLFIPIDIELYKIVDTEEELIMTCNQTIERNEQNEVICDSPIQEMEYSSEAVDDYKLKVIFSNDYSDAIYADLVDYLDISIKSWQKVGE